MLKSLRTGKRFFPKSSKTLFPRTHRLRTARIRFPPDIPQRKQHFSCLRQMPVRQTQSGNHRTGPYHGEGQANGLCFSVADGVPFPPSLQNIFQEVADDTGSPIPTSGNLDRWAEQGVLLLNAVLTVRAHEAASHAGHGWETFTDAVVRAIAQRKQGIVYMLWEVTPSAKAPSPIPSATASSKPSIPPRCRPTGDFSAANTFPGPTNICKASERHRFCGKHNNF